MIKDDYYSDEPIPSRDDDRTAEDGSQREWDYVDAPQESSHRGTWLDAYERNNPDHAPQRLRQLWEKMAEMPWQITRGKAFREQAELMADYEDDAPMVDFNCYYPTYRDMDVAQLRCYFTLRKLLRRETYPEAPLSYLFVYSYELLMVIGVDDAEEALFLLQGLRHHYADNARLRAYLDRWVGDFVVYHNMKGHFKELFQTTDDEAEVMATLRDYRKADDERLLRSILRLTRYNIGHSPVMKEAPQEVRNVLAKVIREVVPTLEKTYHHRLDTLLMGARKRRSYVMFDRAVYYNPSPVREASIEVSPRRSYRCERGLWSVTEQQPDGLTQSATGQLDNVVHETDRLLRLHYGKGGRLKPRLLAASLRETVAASVEAYFREQRQQALLQRAHVDFGKLSTIRDDAKVVETALLTDEEKSSSHAEAEATKPTAPQPAAPPPTAADSLFTGAEQGYLKLLLAGSSTADYLRQVHTPEGVMTDAINEKAMAKLGDIVLESGDNGMEIIEDYVEFVKESVWLE